MCTRVSLSHGRSKDIPMRRIVLAVLALVVGLPLGVKAQETAQPENYTDVAWYEVHYTKFKQGTHEQAERIIREHFIPVDIAVGRDVIPFDYSSGEWDHVIYFPIDGPAELEWRRSPMDVKWWAALVEQEGGVDEAGQLVQSFDQLIVRREIHLARLYLYGER